MHLIFKRVFTAFSSTPLLVGSYGCISKLYVRTVTFSSSVFVWVLNAKADTSIIDITTEVEANLVAHIDDIFPLIA